MSGPDKTFSEADKPLSKLDKTFLEADKPLSKPDKTFSEVDRLLSKPDKAFSQPLPTHANAAPCLEWRSVERFTDAEISQSPPYTARRK